jgi:hypothetical protein
MVSVIDRKAKVYEWGKKKTMHSETGCMAKNY